LRALHPHCPARLPVSALRSFASRSFGPQNRPARRYHHSTPLYRHLPPSTCSYHRRVALLHLTTFISRVKDVSLLYSAAHTSLPGVLLRVPTALTWRDSCERSGANCRCALRLWLGIAKCAPGPTSLAILNFTHTSAPLWTLGYFLEMIDVADSY
jgi:hypothetical protein